MPAARASGPSRRRRRPPRPPPTTTTIASCLLLRPSPRPSSTGHRLLDGGLVFGRELARAVDDDVAAAEVALDDARVGDDVLREPFDDHRAELERDQAIGQAGNEGHVVL